MHDYEAGKDGLAVIVVGVDGTSSALHAAAWASGLARRERARLVFVYVEPLSSSAYWSPFGLTTTAETAGELVDELRRTITEYLGSVGVRWELVHHRGDPGHGLEKVAEEVHADCVVIGRGGGGVAKYLINDARRPVVVVP